MRVRAIATVAEQDLLQRLPDAVDVGGFDAAARAAVVQQLVQRGVTRREREDRAGPAAM